MESSGSFSRRTGLNISSPIMITTSLKHIFLLPDTYIEKDLSINEEIEKLRLSATSALLSGRKDVIVVSSISCIYGIGNPDDFHSNTVHIRQDQIIARNLFLRKLVDSLYSRNELEFKHGTFRVTGRYHRYYAFVCRHCSSCGLFW